MTQEETTQAEGRAARPRGKLKIFLGAVAGVGKTYRMLAEAHRRVERNGEDVVVGLVETHGRPATEQLLAGLEQLPRKPVEYRGRVFYELDVEAVIRRNPEWVLVDELAHTNVPGAGHAKRWQDVEQILAAGISVITTLNVQHLESLNDAVFEITGVRVQETIPDSVVDAADEIELEDLTPDALINRLRRGDIYHGEKIPQALTNFFRKGNIVALRELALRKTVDEVDTQLHDYMEAHHMAQGKAAHDHITVLVGPRPLAARLVRRGYQLAKRMQGTFSAVHVRVPGATLNPKEQSFLDEAYELTRHLGGQVVELQGESVAEEIVKHVGEAGTTFIVMGQSARGRLEEIIRGSIINRIMRQTRNIDIVVVADVKEETPEA
jgi:two-component system sensor histidine kinase KdpD